MQKMLEGLWGYLTPPSLDGLLTPIIALVTVYIAYQQYHLERVRWKMQLYDRRYQIFRAVAELIAEILQIGTVSDEGLRKFLRESRDKSFFFEKDIQDFLDAVYEKAVDLKTFSDVIAGGGNHETIEKKEELQLWFSGKIDEAREKFGEYLAIHDK
ncbi:MAG: hypothetical protein HY313_08865 [Acidobacteria bacterium]|nr:hypothetical protein [Acidobacteriota bacterium]